MSYPAPPPASPPPAQQPPSGPSQGTTPRDRASGFVNDLLDVRFTRFVSLRLISVVYVVILAAVSLLALGVVFTGFTYGPGPGLFALVLAALGWVIYVVLARVALEAFAVLFRIHDDTSRMAEALGGLAPGADPASSGGAFGPGGGGYGGGYGTAGGYGASGGYGQTPPQDPAGPPWV